jgi:FkbM family methyltransferase
MIENLLSIYSKNRELVNKLPFSRSLVLFLWRNYSKNSSQFKTTILNSQEFILRSGSEYLSETILLNGYYEKTTTDQIRKKLSEDSVFVDIGANMGYHSVVAALQEAEIIAYEPEPTNFSILKQNFDLIENDAKLYQKAVGDERGHENLYIDENSTGRHSIVRESGKSIQVQKTRMDDEGIKNPDLVKIDVEGYETEVVKGMRGLIQEFYPDIILEYNPDIWQESERKALLEFFSKEDYKVYILGNSKEKIDYESLLEGENPIDKKSYNLMFEKV